MNEPQPTLEPARGLTPEQMRRILALHYPGPGGALDVHAAAEGLGVSHRTLRRWTSPTTTGAYTEAQVQRRIGPLLPSSSVLIDEQNKLEHDLQGLAWMKKDRSRIPVLWRNNGWLKPFNVYLVQLPDKKVCTVRITNKATLVEGKDGHLLEHHTFPTRIHAEAHVLQMLTQLRPWRFQAPQAWDLYAPTRCWLDDAPQAALRTAHESHTIQSPNPQETP